MLRARLHDPGFLEQPVASLGGSLGASPGAHALGQPSVEPDGILRALRREAEALLNSDAGVKKPASEKKPK